MANTGIPRAAFRRDVMFVLRSCVKDSVPAALSEDRQSKEEIGLDHVTIERAQFPGP